jgi:protein transport protein SEC61 subunit gamma-like protein
VKILSKLPKIRTDEPFMQRARNLQEKLEAKQKRIGKGKYGRVLKMARKPTNDEYSKTSKITGAGILLVGGLGFLIWLLTKHLAPWIAEQLAGMF